MGGDKQPAEIGEWASEGKGQKIGGEAPPLPLAPLAAPTPIPALKSRGAFQHVLTNPRTVSVGDSLPGAKGGRSGGSYRQSD